MAVRLKAAAPVDAEVQPPKNPAPVGRGAAVRAAALEPGLAGVGDGPQQISSGARAPDPLLTGATAIGRAVLRRVVPTAVTVTWARSVTGAAVAVTGAVVAAVTAADGRADGEAGKRRAGIVATAVITAAIAAAVTAVVAAAATVGPSRPQRSCWRDGRQWRRRRCGYCSGPPPGRPWPASHRRPSRRPHRHSSICSLKISCLHVIAPKSALCSLNYRVNLKYYRRSEPRVNEYYVQC